MNSIFQMAMQIVHLHPFKNYPDNEEGLTGMVTKLHRDTGEPVSIRDIMERCESNQERLLYLVKKAVRRELIFRWRAETRGRKILMLPTMKGEQLSDERFNQEDDIDFSTWAAG